MTIGNPAICIGLYLTGVHFRGEVQYFRHLGVQKIKCRPFRTREIGDVRLQEELCKTEQKNITLCGKNIPAFLVHHFFNRPFTSNINILTTEIVTRMCTIKKIFLKISH